MTITKKKVLEKLTEVLDPELNISIVDLGLVYKVEVGKQVNPVTRKHSGYGIKITMTLTTVGCPLIETIEQDIKQKLKDIGIDEKNVKVELTFDPPWSMEKMSPRAKAMLGI